MTFNTSLLLEESLPTADRGFRLCRRIARTGHGPECSKKRRERRYLFGFRMSSAHRCVNGLLNLGLQCRRASIPCPGAGIGRAQKREDALGCAEVPIAQSVSESFIAVTIGMSTVAAQPPFMGYSRVVKQVLSGLRFAH